VNYHHRTMNVFNIIDRSVAESRKPPHGHIRVKSPADVNV
jgi:hypothetical protein